MVMAEGERASSGGQNDMERELICSVSQGPASTVVGVVVVVVMVVVMAMFAEGT
jgi:hypothetical protein